jgi:HEAT repeat protein
MRRLALAVAFALAAPSARADEPAATTSWEAARAAAADAVKRGRLDGSSTGLAASAAAAGLDEAALLRLLGDLLAHCAAPDACPQVVGEPATKELADALGELGTPASASVLLQLDRRGLYTADLALTKILAREMAAAIPSAACAPPSADEVAAARRDLGDFMVLRGRGAAPPTPAELDDLAYFFAAVAHAGPQVGVAPELPGGGPLAPAAAPDPALERLADALRAAQAAGDVRGVATHARAYLERLGYPGPLRAAGETTWAWGGARYSYVLRDLALASEVLGDVDLAGRLWRRADPGGGACGTSTSYRWSQQIEGAIRAAERAGDCRPAVAERLLDVDGPTRRGSTPDALDYGPARLAAAGFDVARLYRGAVLTAGRDQDLAVVRAALERAPQPHRAAALRRLAQRGPEAWDRRVFAVEGLADAAGRAALPVLQRLLVDAPASLRPRVLSTLGQLATRPSVDPCDPDEHGFLFGEWSSQWSRRVAALGERCETSLRLDASGALVRAVTPWLADADPDVRVAAAEALGRIGHRDALPALRARLRDPHRPGGQTCTDGVCVPYYPVREAAREAVAAIRERSGDDAGWRRRDATRP